MTRYLSPEQVLFVHSRLIAETGGSHGVRDLSMLLSAIGRPTASFDGNELYADVHAKAAALMDSLIRNHPFVDGNKRTAMTCAGVFLRMNGYLLVVEPSEMVRFTLGCAQSFYSLAEITEWLRKYCIPVD